MGSEAERIVEAGQFLVSRGWAPAGSGNYSARRADGEIAITVSGAHKARLTRDEVMTIDAEGRARDGRRPSAEAALHLAIYRLFPHVRAVLHTHSIPAVVLSRKIGPTLHLAGYELLKAFPGVDSHEAAIDLPVFDNSQDMDALAARVSAELTARPAPAFLIRDHGLYGWGETMDEALRVVEAAETLIACELELTR
ncbi:MAG: methylthioribulose 1-phosphate dehydratase [Caulobacteraceae bacterium]